MDAVNLTVSFWKIVSKSNIIFKYYDMKHYRAPTKIYLNVSDECKIKQWFFGSVLKRLTKKGWIFSCQHFIIRGYVVHTPIQKFNVYPVFLFSLCQYCIKFMLQFSSVQSLSHVQLFAMDCIPHGLQHTRLPCPSPTPRAYSNSCPSQWSQWCHPTISSSVVPFSSHLQSCPASGSFPVSQFFTSGGQTIRVSAPASVLPVNIQDWFPLEWISLQSKGLSRVFSNTTVQKHKFSGAQLSL